MKKDGYVSHSIVIFCITRLPLFIMLADIALRLNTAYYKRGLIVLQRWNIARHYIKHRMFLDLSIVLLFAVTDLQNMNTLALITILLINKISQVRKEFEDAIALDKKKQAFYQLGKLSLFVVMIAHFCGCIFWSIGLQSQNYEESWIQKEHLQNTAFYEKYVSSLYWATVTMLTVGYGDITPVNKIEKQFVIVIMIFSCGIYAYSLNQIGVLIEEITYEDKEFKQVYSKLSLYMKKRNLDVRIQTEVSYQLFIHSYLLINKVFQKEYILQLKSLQSFYTLKQVKRYYQYLHWEKHNYSQNGEQLLNPLNHSLKQKVILDINYQLLEKNKMFRLQFSLDFLQQLALVMKEKVYMPDDIIWKSNELKTNNNKLFFIIRGQVIQKVNNQFAVKLIDEGSYFNEKCFIMDETPNKNSFSSTCISTIVYLDKKDFLEIIVKYPKDYEIYCKNRDKSKNSQDSLSVLDSKCETCELFTHQFNNCPQVNFTINKEKLIYNLNHMQTLNERKNFKRNQIYDMYQSINSEQKNQDRSFQQNYRRINALVHRRNIFDTVIDYLIEKNPLELDEDNLINYIKKMIQENEGPEDSPDLNIKQPILPGQVHQRHKSFIHPLHVGIGSRFQDENISPSRLHQQFPKNDEIYLREQSGLESNNANKNYIQQNSKTSTRGKQKSVAGGAISSQGHSNLQSNNTPHTRDSGYYSRRYGDQNHLQKQTSLLDLASNENIKVLPNDTDIKQQIDKSGRIETETGQKRFSATTKSQLLNSISFNVGGGQSPYPNSMAQSSFAASCYSGPAALNDINNSLELSDQIGFISIQLQSNDLDEMNISDALKNLQNNRKNQKNPQNHLQKNGSTYTIQEEGTQENQTNFQKTLHVNTKNLENGNYNSYKEIGDESSSPQPDLYPKMKDEIYQTNQSAKLILDTTDIMANTSYVNIANNYQHNILNNSLQNYSQPQIINTPNNYQNTLINNTPQNTSAKRNSMTNNKLQNFIRSNSQSNALSPMSKKTNNKGIYGPNISREDGMFFRMGSHVANSKGGSQYGIHGEDQGIQKLYSIRGRNKTNSTQLSIQKHLNRNKEEGSQRNKIKPDSNNFIRNIQNESVNTEESEIIFISPLTHEFSDVPNLDKNHEYEYYFPDYNIKKVMKQLSKIIQTNIDNQKKNKMSKLDRFLLKINSNRTNIRNKTSRQSGSPQRSKTMRKTIVGVPYTKSAFHQLHPIK